MNTNQKFKNFYDQIDKLLDEMAPIKKLTKKEQGLKKRPWITYGILTSMKKETNSTMTSPMKKSQNKKKTFILLISVIGMKLLIL